MNGCRAAAGNILLVKTGAIGDVVMTTPSIRCLRDAFRGARITYLIGRESSPVLTGSPHIDEVIRFDDSIMIERRYADIFMLLRRLRAKRFDMVVAFHLNRMVHAFSYALGAKVRAGVFRGRPGLLTHGVDIKGREGRHPADLYLELIASLGVKAEKECRMEIFLTPEDGGYSGRFRKGRLDGKSPAIGLFPGGGKNAATDFSQKRWGIEKFAKLCLLILERYPEAGIVVLGSSKEAHLSLALPNSPAIIDLIGHTSLRETIAIMSLLDLAVTNDSSPLHLGSALGVPMVSIFGPTSWKKYAKAGALHKVIYSPAACSPCEDFRGRNASMCADNRCMELISVKEVFDACCEVLDRKDSLKLAGVE